jgi:hypothetical protein
MKTHNSGSLNGSSPVVDPELLSQDLHELWLEWVDISIKKLKFSRPKAREWATRSILIHQHIQHEFGE